MKTLQEWIEWIEARAIRQDGCLIWQAAFNGNSPMTCLGDGDGKYNVNVRRTLWEAKVGRPPARSWVVVCKCETHGCVEPEHLKAISRSQMLAGRTLSVEHRMAVTKAARARKNLKLTQAAVDDIRYGEGSNAEKALRYGITLEYVGDVIAHRAWKEHRSPFAGLFSANDSSRRAA